MAVKLRLARIGKKKAPYFRIVAIDGRDKRDGQFIENLGTYNPLTGEIIQFHIEKIKDWMSKGAIPSDTVKRIVKKFETEKITGPAVKVASVKKAKKVSTIDMAQEKVVKKIAEAITEQAAEQKD